MPLPVLPQEIVDEIILHSVSVRGVKRALRLRFVSKSWDAAVLYALCTSGVFVGPYHALSFNCSFVSFYFTKLIMSRLHTSSRTLGIIERIARRIVSHRTTGNADGNNYDAVRDCVFNLCQIWDGPSGMNQARFALLEDEVLSDDKRDEQFNHALLAGAVWTGETALAHEILPFFNDRLHLLGTDNPLCGFRSVFRNPISLAAYRGNVEILHTLLSLVSTDRPKDIPVYGKALEYAARGNQLSTFDLVLDMSRELMSKRHLHYGPRLIAGIQETNDMGIFMRLVELARSVYPLPEQWRHHICPALLTKVVRRGNLDILKYLVEEEEGCFGCFDYIKQHLVQRAIEAGSLHILGYLLGKGVPINSYVPRYAAQNRNPKALQILIASSVQRDVSLYYGRALVIATERENEETVRILLQSQHVKIEDKFLSKARRRAEELGLESMIKIHAS
ncbi:hypothetical protein F5Y18DRAFT_443960 [Xylariaceae sp. FL1019]|nr:hypothetical protein F5Y18DRAFT_443960 [Xylariaceae sp. FL1019]